MTHRNYSGSHRFRSWLAGISPHSIAAGCAVVVLAALAAPAARATTAVTPSGWTVSPVGHQIEMSSAMDAGFQGPLGSAISPGGRTMLSLSSGASRLNSTDMFNLRTKRRITFVPYDAKRGLGEAVFYGVVYSPDGRWAYASGGGQNVVHVYRTGPGSIREVAQIPTPYFPAGLAWGHTKRGPRIYVANNLSGPPLIDNPPGGQVTVIDPRSNVVTGTINLGAKHAPLGVTFDRTGQKAYVTNWLGRSVVAIDTRRQRKLRTILLSPLTAPMKADHPGAIAANPVRNEVYTANANSDTVSIINTKQDRLVKTLNVGLVPGGPKGAQPSGLAVSPKGQWLFVSLSGENAVAMVDVKRRRVIGFIPAAWAPTDVDITPNGRTIVVTNTNGIGPGPNVCGPHSPRAGCGQVEPPDPDLQTEQGKVKALGRGSVSIIDLPATRRTLNRWTGIVRRNNQVRARRRAKPAFLNGVKHVIYVIKENRTYDSMFGDLGKGNGAPDLNLFGDDVAPNHRELARRFTLFDNFYADAEVSADGHQWATQADATDYVEKTWPISYSPPPRNAQRARDFEDVLTQRFGSEPLAGYPSIPRTAAASTNGYLWDNAWRSRVSFRDYGEYVHDANCSGRPNISHTTHLDPIFGDHVNPDYPGFNLDCSDHTVREPIWEREFKAWDAEHSANPARDRMPQLEVMRFPNDHTAATNAGKGTPQAYVADNDLALGKLVDAVSHSSYWKSTVILVTEDDAQDGPDHVDAHRTVALAISPYTQTGGVDSTHYDTSAMLATLEDLLGMPSMSIVDQRATRMWAAFRQDGSDAPYNAITPSVTPYGADGYPVNTKRSPMAAQSAKWDLTREDAAPEIGLNEAIWRSVKGSGARMPAPRHDRIVGLR
ncbi:MAG: hypothetical protein QOF37_2789 [Thermoleophilaceae bacterium]|nr:hypothetical protein [Thermoleophilaceae bacterium]